MTRGNRWCCHACGEPLVRPGSGGAREAFREHRKTCPDATFGIKNTTTEAHKKGEGCTEKRRRSR